MSDPASITLSPCPFCGGEGRTSKFTAAVVRQPWRALCMNDDCPMEPHCDFSTEAEAIAAWNTRAALQPARAPTPGDVLALVALKNRIDLRLNNHLCEMKEGWDDSIVGFNEAWDTVREVFAEIIREANR